jgi:membrane protease YdiL (CAAX protease family)
MNHTAISVLIVTLSFLLYHFVISNEKLKMYLQSRYGDERGQMFTVVLSRLLGALLFASTALFNWAKHLPLTNVGIDFRYKAVLFLLVLIPVLVNMFAAKSASNLAMYPQIRTKVWSKGLVVLSALTWMIYLLGYEIMFRAVLFENCLNEVGLLSAIAINISIYALVHIPKGLNETIGTLPLGIIFCLLAWITGSFWASFALHVLFALSNEWFSLKYSKEIVIK